MKHLRVAYTPEDIEQRGGAACLAQLEEGDELVDAALQADCDRCRTVVGVAKKDDKTWDGRLFGVQPPPVWKEQPMMNAEEVIASAKRNRL